MALVKRNVLDQMEIVNVGTIPSIQCRYAEWVEEDLTGEIVGGKQYFRKVISPVTDVSNEPSQVVATANAIFTEEVINAYNARLAEIDNQVAAG